MQHSNQKQLSDIFENIKPAKNSKEVVTQSVCLVLFENKSLVTLD